MGRILEVSVGFLGLGLLAAVLTWPLQTFFGLLLLGFVVLCCRHPLAVLLAVLLGGVGN